MDRNFLLLILTASIFLANGTAKADEWPLGSGNYVDAKKIDERFEILSDVVINSLRIRASRLKNSKNSTLETFKCDNDRDEKTTLYVEFHGPIGADAFEVIHRLFKKFDPGLCVNEAFPSGFHPIFVYLNSTGGNLQTGYQIGRLFRDYKITTIVRNGQRYSSACAIAFLGGDLRTIKSRGFIMFHAPYSMTGEEIQCPDSDSPIAKNLKEWYFEFLSSSNAQIVFDRTMDHCSSKNGWVLNGDAAVMFGIAN